MSATCRIPTIFDAPVQHLPSSSSSFYRPELDALRFFAFLGVLFFHAMPGDPSAYAFLGRIADWVAAVIKSGAFGVDLFFALSAYLITILLIREKEIRGSLDVKAFYLRRILRIWPLYFAFVAFAIILTSLHFRSQNLTVAYVAGYLALAGNWVYAVYGLPASVTVPLWSISVEEQFYLLWPMAVRNSSHRLMVWIAVVLLIISNSTRALLVYRTVPEYALEYNTLARIDPIALGILLALFLGYRVTSISVIKRIALFSAAAATWIVVGRYGELNMHHVNALGTLLGRPAVAAASVVMLMAILGLRDKLIHPALLYLGKISYGLYVIHAFGLLVAWKLVGEHSTAYASAKGAMVGLVVTIMLSALSYRWLETPFLSLKRRFTHVASRPS